ncbi:SDR family NAD(P)-dependent oxidoreductase [Rhodospirillaceae bacterium SYSU D60014]|uniref:SDR family NAD(P)-dependent oxidoreductase n=1 Tax=Virgifigura deserti TaxID=2268457 RepID=UPI000E660A05
MSTNETALIVGVGPGLGAALARRFAKAGLTVAMAAREASRLTALADEISGRAYDCDATQEDQVETLFKRVAADIGAPTLAVYNAGAYLPKSVLETEPAEFERCWRIGCLGGFLIGRAAAQMMLAEGGGTILFTGATASLRGSAGFVNLAVGKFGLRAVAQSMARELGPRGIHVAHIVIDGQIGSGEDGTLKPEAIAETYWQLHQQPPSAWTQEIDLRPATEKF